VLVNLAVNARDAMPTGGKLAIDTANVSLDEEEDSRITTLPAGRYVRLRVSDTGTGMSREVADRAFEPFFTTKAEGSGTGLGLATTYGIISQAGGDVQIYSEIGHGTTVNILLPVTARSAAAPSVAEQQPVSRDRDDHGADTILIVEDEDALREVTRRILARSGYQVLTAAGGAEAIDLAGRHHGEIHLLITDVVMPSMLGKEVAERVQAIRPGIRVLYMSGYAQPVLASQGTLDPDVVLLEKPFSAATLLDQIREIFDRS